jgi:hypothetical protein
MTAPDDITEAELEAIQARCEAATQMAHVRQPNWEAYALGMLSQCAMDERALLAAVRKRDAEIERLRETALQLSCSDERAQHYEAERDAAKALLARAAELIRDMLVWGTNIDCTTESRKVLAEIEGAEHGKP